MSDSACYIIGAGPFFGLVQPPREGDYILAADGGYRHCLTAGLTPDLLLGDFDSLEDRPTTLETKTFPVEKDDTDSMLAIKLGLAKGFRTFHLYGGTGGRMDHTLANLQGLGYLARHGAQGFLYDESYVFTAIRNSSITLPAREEGIFSVFCLGPEAHGISIRGAKYNLEGADLDAFFPLGVSNHFQGSTVEIHVEDGCLLIGWEI